MGENASLSRDANQQLVLQNLHRRKIGRENDETYDMSLRPPALMDSFPVLRYPAVWWWRQYG
jgi:hypothetical protein